MEFDEVDVNEREKQRYEHIKKSGRYTELNVLIGVESEGFADDTEYKTPVITLDMHNCTAKEVSCMYISLKEIMNTLEKQYPAECLIAKLGMGVETLGSLNFESSDDTDTKK